DHASFYTKEVPVLYFTTGVHKEYHTPSDDFDLINFAGLKMVTDIISDIVYNISEKGFVPVYQKSEAPVSSARSSFKVTLGVIPDFTYEKGDGFRVGSVSDGRPAQRAGMKEGDIIISMNSKKINNIYDYMSALGELKQGSKAQVIIKRDSTEITLQIDL
ncbi:MAG: PDZ domain-containing protein, partial [Bacteroidales bacterium]|nr:PDZ domain-containing protein [Bacteroidales bacterium]